MTRYVLFLFMLTLFDGQAPQIHNMSAEIEAIGSKHTEALAKIEEVAGREAELVESLRKAGETHSADVDALQVQHAQALEMKEAEVDDLINRLEAEHEDPLAERLAIAAADLEKAHKDHAEVFGRLKAEHEAELECRNEVIKDLLANSEAIARGRVGCYPRFPRLRYFGQGESPHNCSKTP